MTDQEYIEKVVRAAERHRRVQAMKDRTATRRTIAIRQALSYFGLRVCCLLCPFEGRYHAETGTITSVGIDTKHNRPRARVRTLRCPLCGEIALCSEYWTRRFPERASKRRHELRAKRDALRS